jgi:hypothetical protein
MTQAQTHIRVENTGDALICFPNQKQAAGRARVGAFRLVPGGNNVPRSIVEAFEAGKVMDGPKVMWGRYKDSGKIKVASVTESAALTKQPEGPEAPSNLHDRTPAAALAIVKITSDAAVLKLWAAAEQRGPVQGAIRSRLTELGALE